MEIIEFKNLPKNIQLKYKKIFDLKIQNLFKEMGVELTKNGYDYWWGKELEDIRFTGMPGIYQYFKLQRL